MKLKKTITALSLASAFMGMAAQEHVPPIRVVDTKKASTVVYQASSSSSTSCQSPDFPVLRGGSRKDVNFNDLNWITVRHDLPVADENLYITVELTSRNGTTEVLEMIKSIRLTGKTDQGDFSIEVKDISTVQVLHGP
jgi:hypothetical protein